MTKANQNEALLWKVAVLGMVKPPVGAGTFCRSPMLVFYSPPCRKCLPAWRNVKYQYGPGSRCTRTNSGLFPSQNCSFPEESFIIYILCSSTQGNHGLGVKDRITNPEEVSSILPWARFQFFSFWVSLRNIPEPPEKLAIGRSIYPGLTGEIFSLPLTVDSGAIRSGWRNNS